MAGCGAGDSVEGEGCQDEIKGNDKSARVGRLKLAGQMAGVRNNML